MTNALITWGAACLRQRGPLAFLWSVKESDVRASHIGIQAPVFGSVFGVIELILIRKYRAIDDDDAYIHDERNHLEMAVTSVT